MFGNNGEYEYCLWSFAARSIMFGNKSEYEYCLWSYASEVRGAERRKQPKAARQEGSLVRCHFDRSAEVLGAERRNLLYTEKRFLDCARNDGIRYYLFGCNAKPSTQPTHGSRQAFGLHSACAKPLACRRKVIPARVALISTHAKSDATRAAFNPNYFSPYTYRRPTKSTFCAAPRPPVRAGARTPSGGAR